MKPLLCPVNFLNLQILCQTVLESVLFKLNISLYSVRALKIYSDYLAFCYSTGTIVQVFMQVLTTGIDLLAFN